MFETLFLLCIFINTMYIDHIHAPSPPSHISLGVGSPLMSVVNLPGATPLTETDSPSLRSQQLSIVPEEWKLVYISHY